MAKVEGRCLCGAITYSTAAEPLGSGICHCKDCQRQAGTAFSVVVAVPEDALDVRGDTLATIETTGEDHGGATQRRFCSACGSPILSLSPGLPGVALIKAGTLDDTSWLRPQAEYWCGSAQPWVPAVVEDARHPRGLGSP